MALRESRHSWMAAASGMMLPCSRRMSGKFCSVVEGWLFDVCSCSTGCFAKWQTVLLLMHGFLSHRDCSLHTEKQMCVSGLCYNSTVWQEVLLAWSLVQLLQPCKQNTRVAYVPTHASYCSTFCCPAATHIGVVMSDTVVSQSCRP